jgi:hypothetical protein
MKIKFLSDIVDQLVQIEIINGACDVIKLPIISGCMPTSFTGWKRGWVHARGFHVLKESTQ